MAITLSYQGNTESDNMITEVIDFLKTNKGYLKKSPKILLERLEKDDIKSTEKECKHAQTIMRQSNDGKDLKLRSIWEGPNGEIKFSYRVNETEKEVNKDILSIFKQQAKDFSPNYPEVVLPESNDELMLEISLFDHHFGKRSWEEETGNKYDLNIAVKLYREAIQNSIDIIKSNKVGKVLLIVGNDLFNSDNIDYTTTKGTPQQDSDSWQKSFQAASEILVESIDRLSEHCHVHILVVPGNHDFQRTYYLGCYLDAWYNKNKNVYVDNRPSSRKYFKFGKCLLGFTHGDKERIDDLPLLMATEQPKMWATAKYREWHLGHFHKTRTDEKMGVITRILPSLAGPDSWHHIKGFVGNIQSTHSYLWNKKTGLKAIHLYNVN